MTAEPDSRDAPDASPSVKLLQRILDSLDVLAVVAGADGRVVIFNRAAEQLTGYRASDAIGRPLGELLLAEPLPSLAERIRERLAEGPGPLRHELWVRTRNDERRLVAWSTELVPDDGGDGPLIVATGRDVTDQRRLEAELRERERVLRLIVESGPIGIARYDRDRIITFANRVYAAFYGRRPEELIGQPGEAVLGPERAARAMPYVEAVLAGREQSFETRVPNADGALRTMQVRMVPERDAGGAVAGFLIFGLDISDVAEAQSRASRLERRLLDAIEHSTGAVMMTDHDDRVVLWNRAYEAIFPHQVPIRPGTPFRDILEKAMQRSVVHSQAPQDWIAARLAVHRDAGAPFVYEMSDGRWLLCVESIMHDGGRMAITIDITEQKRAELELARSNRELQQFASVASHDLREPLRKVYTFGKLLSDRYADRLDEAGRGHLASVIDAADRMRQLIDDLMRYSRVGTQAEPLRPTDLNAVLRGVLADLELAIAEADAVVEVQPLPWIEADAGQIRQLFQNLLANALKYRARDRRLRIAVTAALRDGRWTVRVADNGIGFEPQYAERIFGIFQRLHGRSEYPGTGIGLALCRKIVERHRGSITATGEPGAGASFEIVLPARQEREEAGPGRHGGPGGRE